MISKPVLIVASVYFVILFLLFLLLFVVDALRNSGYFIAANKVVNFIYAGWETMFVIGIVFIALVTCS